MAVTSFHRQSVQHILSVRLADMAIGYVRTLLSSAAGSALGRREPPVVITAAAEFIDEPVDDTVATPPVVSARRDEVVAEGYGGRLHGRSVGVLSPPHVPYNVPPYRPGAIQFTTARTTRGFSPAPPSQAR